MSETIELQEKIREMSLSPIKDTGAGFLYPLAGLCASVGDVAQKVEKGIDFDELPEGFKLDLWEFAVAAGRMKDWAVKIRNGETIVPAEAVRKGVDAGDLGEKAKEELADTLQMLGELCAELKINLREISHMVQNRERESDGIKEG